MNNITLGWIIDKNQDQTFKDYVKACVEQIKTFLQKEFSQFNWECSLIQRKDFPHEADPLQLLEFGANLKLEYNFDFCLVITDLPLRSRLNQSISCVPSVVLETAVISTSRIEENFGQDPKKIVQTITNLILYNLIYLWGGDALASEKLKKDLNSIQNNFCSPLEKAQILEYLQKIADPRLEETDQGSRLASFLFYAKVILKEFPLLLRDIFLFRSWLLFLGLGKVTVATAISIIFLFLSAEAWEMGAALQTPWINVVILGVIGLATVSLYFGQNLHRVAKFSKMKEQAVRSKVILFGTLLASMLIFWLGLLLISWSIISLLPAKVLLGWAGLKGKLPSFHFAKIMATFGVLASALGGNLEDTKTIKAVLFYSEEV